MSATRPIPKSTFNTGKAATSPPSFDHRASSQTSPILPISHEIYWLRFFGCILVFLYHYIGRIEQAVGSSPLLSLLRVPTALGTPTFLFITSFLFTYKYTTNLPSDFLRTRAKYLLTPYVAYGTIYALLKYIQELARGNRDVELVSTLLD